MIVQADKFDVFHVWDLLIVTVVLLVFYYVIVWRQEIRKNGWVAVLIGALGLLAALSSTLINAYFKMLPGGKADARGFTDEAREIILHNAWSIVPGNDTFASHLAAYFKVFGSTFLTGGCVSLIYFALAVPVFLQIQSKLFKSVPPLVQIAGLMFLLLLPTYILRVGLPMREPIQVACLICQVYYVLRLKLYNENVYWQIAFFTIALAMIHKATLLIAPLVLLVALFWKPYQKRSILSSGRVLATILCLGILFAGAALARTSLGNKIQILSILTSDDVSGNIESNRMSRIKGRTSYEASLDVSGPIPLIKSVGNIMVNYSLRPFPNQLQTGLDFYGFFDTVLRTSLLLFAFYLWFISVGYQKQGVGFLLVIYFLIEIIWAVGTSNWGTAVRHHMTNYWIVALLGSMGGYRFMQRQILPFLRSERSVLSA